jgi:hypothetical protein
LHVSSETLIVSFERMVARRDSPSTIALRRADNCHRDPTHVFRRYVLGGKVQIQVECPVDSCFGIAPLAMHGVGR